MQEKDNEQIPENFNNEFEIPKNYRIVITILASLFSIFIISLYLYLIFCNPNYLDPGKFGLSTLLIFSLTLLLIVNLPWKKLGLRITKIGMIELAQTIKGQAKNVSKDIAELQVKIDEVGKKAGGTGIIEDNNLADLLIKFLTEYHSWSFSPLRIKNWGASKKDYYSFNDHTLDQIKTELRRLLANDKVSTRISRKGNTLYRIKK